MPPKKQKQSVAQENKISQYFQSTPSRPIQNAAFASSPAAPSTIQETPVTNVATTADHPEPSSPILSSPSPSSSPLAPPEDSPKYDRTNDLPKSSMPHSSGLSSKRTFVPNSESDGEVSDLDGPNSASESEFSDLDDIWHTKSTATMKGGDGSGGYVLPKPSERQRDDTEFHRLVQEAHENAEMEKQIAEAQADLDRALSRKTPERNLDLSEEMVAGALKGSHDPEKAKKLYLAMQRTNALHVGCAFYFFDQPVHAQTSTSLSLSSNLLSQPRLMSFFKDTTSRDEAFLSGFAQHIFQKELPEELIMWMVDELCIGKSEALSAKYIQLLDLHRHTLERVLSTKKLQEMFLALGANRNYLDEASEIEVTPSYEQNKVTICSLPTCLCNVCRLLQLAASGFRPDVRAQALRILAHVCLDERVQGDNAILSTVQDTIESLVRTTTENAQLAILLDDLVSNLVVGIKHPILQQNLVRALPDRSPLTASLQRYLALSFLLYPEKFIHPFGSTEALDMIHRHLQTSTKFRIAKDTDYASLAAQFTLLDIAIGPGPLAVPYQPLISPPASQNPRIFASNIDLTPPPGDVQGFNREVDALAKQIKLLGNGINVAGAITDLNRLAANDCCDRLCTRLEHAVRIGGRKVKNIFQENYVEKQHSRAYMGRFLKGVRGNSNSDSGVANESGMATGSDDEEFTDRL